MATAVSESKPPAVTVSRASTAASTAFQHVPPFDEGDQLCKDLKWTHSKSSGLPCLQSQRAALRTLPDAPRVPLDGSRIMPYCLEDLDTPGMVRVECKPQAKTLPLFILTRSPECARGEAFLGRTVHDREASQ
jgi:hypothetical protein